MQPRILVHHILYLLTLPRDIAVNLVQFVMVVLLLTNSLLAQRYGQVWRDNVDISWSEEERWLTYSVDVAQGEFEHYFVNLETGEKSPVYDEDQLCAALTGLLSHTVTQNDLLRLRNVEVVEASGTFEFSFDNAAWRCDSNYFLEQLDHGALPNSTALTRRSRSSGSDQETELRIVNNLDNAIVCHWLSTEGSPVKYQTIAPGDHIAQHTFENHIWSFRDDKNKELVRVKATASPLAIEIDEDLTRAFQRLPAKQSSRQGTRRRPRNDGGFYIKDNNVWRSSTSGNPVEKIRGIASQLQNIWTPSKNGNSPFQLTHDGTEKHPYRGPLRSSKDGRFVAALRVKTAPLRQIQLVESSPKEQLQPVIHTLDYAKPGDKIDAPEVVVIDVEAKTQFTVSHPQLGTSWRIQQLQWLDTPEERLFFLYNQRGHQALRVFSVVPQSSEVSLIIDETSPTFIDYSNKTLLRPIFGGRELIWMSERSGFNHLYRFNAANGELINAITHGDWIVRDVEKIDEENQQIWFSASGIDAQQDPYYRHLCRINFDGSNFVQLTSGDGDHRWEFSPSRKWIVDKYSRADLPTVTSIADAASGNVVGKLEEADCQEMLDSGWSMPQRFSAKGRDGETDIFGIIVRPSEVAPGKKYPVVEKIYAGPHSSHVPKSFGLLRQEQELAKMGFVVVRIDGMGTSNRGKAFHDVCWKNIADAGFPDRIRWIRAAAMKFQNMDLSRVGIFGGSAGGQNAMRALIDHHDFYHVAVADCGCHDNRMDKIWWNEAWMGWPVDESYARSSNVVHAHRMEGKLLLIVGELDKNVDPASTMQVADALVKAEKDFELLVIPGAGHGAAETPYGNRRRVEFLTRHLLDK